MARDCGGGGRVGLALFGLRALPAALAATTVLVRECGPLLLLAGGAAGRVATTLLAVARPGRGGRRWGQ